MNIVKTTHINHFDHSAVLICVMQTLQDSWCLIDVDPSERYVPILSTSLLITEIASKHKISCSEKGEEKEGSRVVSRENDKMSGLGDDKLLFIEAHKL